MLHNGQLERDDVLVMNLTSQLCLSYMMKRRPAHPVFGCTPYESILISSSRRVSLDRVSSRSHQVEKFGELDNQVVVIHAVERV